MEFLGFFLSHYAVLAVTVALCGLFGAHASRHVAFDSHVERACFAITLGFGLVSHTVLFLGLTGLLSSHYVVIVVLVGLAICHKTLVRFRQVAAACVSRIQGAGFAQVTQATLGIVACLPSMLLALYPPTIWDSTMYHLAYAKIYVQHGGVVFTEYLRFPVFPQTNDMLFTLALLFQDDILAHGVELVLMATLAVASFAYARRFISLRAGWWAAAIFLGSPLVIRLGTVAYVDMGLALFSTMALHACMIWLKTREESWIVLAAVLAGCAIGTKYTGLFSLVTLLVVVAVARASRRDLWRPVRLAAIAMAVAAPWLLRNYYFMRNPLFPFFHNTFGQIFGYGAWEPREFEGLYDDYSRYGRGKGLVAFLLLPWNIVVHWREFGGWLTSPIPLFVPQLVFVSGLVRANIAAPLALGMAYLMFWFLTSQETHYLLPALPMLSIAAGGALDGLLHRFGETDRRVPRRMLIATGAILLISPGWIWTVRRLREHGPVPTSRIERDVYLTHWLPSYPAYQFLNGTTGGQHRLYALDDENMAYFSDGVFMGDHFGPARYSRVSPLLADPEALRHELDQLDASHFLVKTGKIPPAILATEAFQTRFRSIFASEAVIVFELTEGTKP